MLVVPKQGTEALFPNSGDGPLPNTVLLQHNVANTILLRKLGFKVPSPIGLYYKYPGPASEPPFKSQLDTCTMLSENPRAYVFNGLGTGKTRSALWAWHFLFTTGMCKKLLVVAPLSTLHFVWAAEVFRLFGNDVRVSILHGTKKQRIEALAKDADVYVVNTDGVKVLTKELTGRTDIDCMVVDELANFRNNSDRSKNLRRLAQRFGVCWGMSGAPLPNSPVDCWAQSKIVTPNTAPKYQRACRDLLMTQVSQYVFKPKPGAVNEAFHIMRPSVRFTLEDVTELPELVLRTVDVELSDQQKKVYKKIKTELVAMVANKQITAVNAGVALNKLVQISLGWIYSSAPAFVRLDSAPRMAAIIDLITSCDQKVILMVPYRHAIEGIAGIFDRIKVPFEYSVVHGDSKNREDIFHTFQSTDNPKVLLAHPGVLAHGLTLHAASMIIWACPITSLETFLQANARITRVGQRHRQQVVMLQGSAIEKRLYSLLRTKELVQSKFLELVEEATA
jgi:SNF2 family DNA or RNA helicase